MSNALQVIIAALVLLMALLLGTTVVDSIAAGEDGIRTSEQSAVLLEDTQTFSQINDGEGYDETVYDSRGYAVNLTGANDSFVESQDGFEVASDGTWSVSVWAHVDNASSGETMTAVSLDGRVIINYNGTDANWTAWYYDESTRDSYQVNVSAPDQPGNLTNVQVVSNSTHLAIYRNNSSGGVVNMSGASVTAAPVNATNWDGRLDELRTFDDALNASQRGALVDDGVGPLPNASRTARVMFDQPDRGVQLLLFTDTSVRQSNVTFSEGLAGEELVSDGVLLQQSDYEFQTDGPALRPISGGRLEGAPVAYVDYEFEDALANIVDGWTALVGVAALAPLLGLIGVILVRVRGV